MLFLPGPGGAEDTDPPPPLRPSRSFSSNLTGFAGGRWSEPAGLASDPNLWSLPSPLEYSQTPYLLLGCGERGQDSGPNDISPFLFPTHTVRPPARDLSDPGTVRNTAPGRGQWQGVGWADSVLAALKLMPRFWHPPEAKPGSAAAGLTDPRKELGRESQPRTLLSAAGHPLLPQGLLEHLPVPGVVPGPENSAGNETQSCACRAGFVSSSLCVERLHQRMSTGAYLPAIPFSMSERHKIITISSPCCLRLGLPRRQSFKPGLACRGAF